MGTGAARVVRLVKGWEVQVGAVFTVYSSAAPAEQNYLRTTDSIACKIPELTVLPYESMLAETENWRQIRGERSAKKKDSLAIWGFGDPLGVNGVKDCLPCRSASAVLVPRRLR